MPERLLLRHPSRTLAFWLGLGLLYVVHGAAALWGERILWGDGSFYVSEILQNREFALGDESRATADVLMELPLMAALSLDVTNLTWLKFAYGVPSFLLIPLGLALLYWMAGEDKRPMAFPLATIAAGLMNTELLPIHESRIAVVLFWVVLFALRDPQRRSSTLFVGAALSVPFIASYESAILLGPILAVIAFERWRTETYGARRHSAFLCLASSVSAFLVALESILRPTHPANFASFRQSWRVVLGEGGIGLHLSLLVLFLALPWLHRKRWLRFATMGAVILVCGAGVVFSLQNPTELAVESQYRARIVNVALPVLASLPFLFFCQTLKDFAPSRNALGVLMVAQVVLQLQMTGQWNAFRRLTREQLSCVSGLIPVDTAVSAHLKEKGLSAEWMRSWHHPTLSFLDRAGPVRAVLDVSNGYTSWQPFYARRLDELPALSRYGVDDREYRVAMERLLHREGPPWEAVSPCPDP